MTDAYTATLAVDTIRESSLYNKDLAPVSPERRTWRIYNYAALWISMSVNIPTYMLASGMIAGGMKATGVGMREMGRVAIDFFTELKAVYIDFTGRKRDSNIY